MGAGRGKWRDIEWELDRESETSSGSWTVKVARHRVGAGRGKWRDIEWELDGESETSSGSWRGK